jgi:hypothetical protein
VQAADQGGLSEHQKVVVAAQLLGPILEARAPVVLFSEALALDHGAHRPVEQQNALGQKRIEFGGVGWLIHGSLAKQKARSARARNGPLCASL